MPGLMLSLKANEKFLINGTLLQNGPRKSQIRIEEDDTRVLRLSDALHPDDVNTPVKRAYYLAQLILSGDMEEEKAAGELLSHLYRLQTIFTDERGAHLIGKATRAAETGRYYSSLCQLKHLLSHEAQILMRASNLRQQAEADLSVQQVA